MAEPFSWDFLTFVGVHCRWVCVCVCAVVPFYTIYTCNFHSSPSTFISYFCPPFSSIPFHSQFIISHNKARKKRITIVILTSIPRSRYSCNEWNESELLLWWLLLLLLQFLNSFFCVLWTFASSILVNVEPSQLHCALHCDFLKYALEISDIANAINNEVKHKTRFKQQKHINEWHEFSSGQKKRIYLMKWIKKYPMFIEFKSVQEFKKSLCEPSKALFYGHFPWNIFSCK